MTGTGPVSVGHYLTGWNYEGFKPNPNCTIGPVEAGIGDPAFTLTPPTFQLRADYIVLTPAKPDGSPYYVQNYLNITYPAGAAILLDDNPLELSDTPVGESSWLVETVAVSPGVHRVDSVNGQGIGVTAYGYDCNVSYAYPGGLNLKPYVEASQ